MWEKIKKFLSKVWWIALVPIAILILHLVFRKETPELDKLIKEKQKEIKEDKKDKESAEKKADKAEESLKDSIEDAKETSIRVETEAEARDKQSEEFFK